uniref:Uncharacterized protein n=1 Tax=Acrobeloides nanus TaxID=290746 RepID=A0A914CNY0_9BILA
MNNSRGASTKSPAVAQIDMDSAQDRDKKFWLQGQLKKLIILTLCLGIIIALLATAILIVRFYISYYVVQGHKFDTQADKFINVNNGLYERPGSPPSKHFTIIFQTLCLMNIYNAITSRLLFDSISWKKWNGDRNCCEVS